MTLRGSIILISIFFFSGLLPISILAQNYAQNKQIQESIQEIIQEKLRIEPEQIETFVEAERIWENGHSTFRRSLGTETQVTNNIIAESEVHAGLNPTDSNNIVLCPIRLIPFGGYTLPIYFSKDFGKSWSESNFDPRPDVSNATVLGGGDPVFAYDAGGKCYYTWISLYRTSTTSYHWALLWAYSDDGGANWQTTDSNYICLSSGNSLGTLPLISDKQWMATDQSNSAHKGNLYVSYLRANMQTGKIRIVVQRKQADSSEFDLNPIEISNGSFTSVQFGNVAVDHNGHVHVTFCDDKRSLWHSKSTDGGESYSSPKLITNFMMPDAITGVKSSGSSPRIYPAPYMAVDQGKSAHAGNIYITWTAKGINSDENTGSDVYFARSTDAGVSWTEPKLLNDDDKLSPKDQFYSNIYVNEEGVVVIGWYDGRHSVSNVQNEITQYYLAYSFDGGQSFTSNFNVSSAFTNFSTVGNKNNQFGVGEYNQVLATKGHAIAVWADGRKGDGDLDIYVAFAKLEKEPQSIAEISQVGGKFSLKSISPNPANQNIIINYSLYEQSRVSFTILSIEGKMALQKEELLKNANDHNCNIDIKSLPSGQYIFLFDTEFGRISQKFMIKR
ncbi:MAG: T9SS type A sorting domain-containing protein [Bacteroidetes bacterium]|jgi:hypothetical protein|nr:T9SS type A sorting domain-containing protein [Bacteroidota bacterium]MBT5530474.1 T9SS type A sorting domain-containing protein [Cytophagia bacterium]MBT3423115.1 T9SS type A sorting domain-containing protein [Bacteroidota bacterium]MBT3935827.1 T9SS type A sorting domain-containing protein [Bacteroidota bacterium]MBT4339029.1 T9SS type A sorting domain-containing protein [Bacteroidota bacterium]